MEAIIGLLGVVVGWLLAFLTDRWKQRMEARNAAALIYAEMTENQAILSQTVKDKDYSIIQTPRRLAWDTYGAILLRIADEGTLVKTIASYHATNLASATVRRFLQESDDNMAKFRAAKARAEDPSIGGALRLELAEELRRRAEAKQVIDESLNKYSITLRDSVVPDSIAAADKVRSLTRFKTNSRRVGSPSAASDA